jgi:NTF2-related export protein 1/2
MAEPPEDIQVKVAGNGNNENSRPLIITKMTAAAQEFVDSYYSALNSTKTKSLLSDFYIKPTAESPLKPDISLNGKVVVDMAELEKIFTQDVEKCHYEAQSFDCHVVNTNYNVGAPENALNPDKDGKKISFTLLVSGSVRYWADGISGESKPFSESFVLVPSRDAHGPKAARGAKKWLIQSQNFRIVG